MKKLTLGTKVRAIHDLASLRQDGSVAIPRGTPGTVTHVGPDAGVGWYGLMFGEIPYAGYVNTQYHAIAEVIT